MIFQSVTCLTISLCLTSCYYIQAVTSLALRPNSTSGPSVPKQNAETLSSTTFVSLTSSNASLGNSTETQTIGMFDSDARTTSHEYERTLRVLTRQIKSTTEMSVEPIITSNFVSLDNNMENFNIIGSYPQLQNTSAEKQHQNHSTDGDSDALLIDEQSPSEFPVENDDMFFELLEQIKSSFDPIMEVSNYSGLTSDSEQSLKQDEIDFAQLNDDLLKHINIQSFIELVHKSEEDRMQGVHQKTEAVPHAFKHNENSIENDHLEPDGMLDVSHDSNSFELNTPDELFGHDDLGSKAFANIDFERIFGRHFPMLKQLQIIPSLHIEKIPKLKFDKIIARTFDNTYPRNILFPSRGIVDSSRKTPRIQALLPLSKHEVRRVPKYNFVALSLSKKGEQKPATSVAHSNVNYSTHDFRIEFTPINSNNASSVNLVKHPNHNKTTDTVLRIATLHFDKQVNSNHTAIMSDLASGSNENSVYFVRMIRSITKKQFSVVDLLLAVCCTVAALLAIVNLSVFALHLFRRKRGTMNLPALSTRASDARPKEKKVSKACVPESKVCSSFPSTNDQNENYFNAETLRIRPLTFAKALPEFDFTKLGNYVNSVSQPTAVESDSKMEENMNAKKDEPNNMNCKMSNILDENKVRMQVMKSLSSTSNEHGLVSNVFPKKEFYNVNQQGTFSKIR